MKRIFIFLFSFSFLSPLFGHWAINEVPNAKTHINFDFDVFENFLTQNIILTSCDIREARLKEEDNTFDFFYLLGKLEAFLDVETFYKKNKKPP